MPEKSPKNIRFNYARIITAFLIVVAIVSAIALGNYYIGVMFLVISAIGARELCYAFEKEKTILRIINYMILGVLPFLIFNLVNLGFGDAYVYILFFTAAVMFFLIINLWFGKINYTKYRFLFTLTYWALPFNLASYFLIFGDKECTLKMMGIIILIWTCDTMAYFTGKTIGKTKLFPSVSPGKTIEGSLGAGFFCILVSLGFAYGLEESYLNWVIVALLVWILGTFGDLVESKLKRVQNVKDSGSILPGHGGFLDRFDSLVLLIPFLLILEYYLQS
jgi:phosphatidate cytidylyltransferase